MRMLLKRQTEKGFTLIELMVVIVIIGILIGVALPNFMGAQDKAKISSVKANMHTFQLAAEDLAVKSDGAYGTAANVAPGLPTPQKRKSTPTMGPLKFPARVSVPGLSGRSSYL